MSNLENEVWVDTYLSTHHEVSNMGRVRSKDRYLKKSGNLILFKSKILKGSIAYGYIRFRFSTEKENILLWEVINLFIIHSIIPNQLKGWLLTTLMATKPITI